MVVLRVKEVRKGDGTCLGIRREDDNDEDDEDDNVGMEFTVVVYNRQFPITGTVPFFFLMQCSRIQGTEREREYKCRLMQCATSFMHLFNIQIWSCPRSTSSVFGS